MKIVPIFLVLLLLILVISCGAPSPPETSEKVSAVASALPSDPLLQQYPDDLDTAWQELESVS